MSTTKIAKDDLLDDLARVNDEVEGSATTAEYRELGEYSYQTLTDRFGSWHQAQELVGGECEQRNIDDEELLADLERVNDELGHPAKQTEYTEHGEFSHGTLQVRFDSWVDAQAELGHDISSRVEHGVDEIFEDIVDVTEELGRSPTTAEYDDRGVVCTSTVSNRLDMTWSRARMRAWRVWQELRGGGT